MKILRDHFSSGPIFRDPKTFKILLVKNCKIHSLKFSWLDTASFQQILAVFRLHSDCIFGYFRILSWPWKPFKILQYSFMSRENITIILVAFCRPICGFFLWKRAFVTKVQSLIKEGETAPLHLCSAKSQED